MKFERHIPYPVDLTPKQIQLVILISDGFTSSEIAEITQLSCHTINTHRKTILERSGCRNWYQYMAQLGQSGRLKQWKLMEKLRKNGSNEQTNGRNGQNGHTEH